MKTLRIVSLAILLHLLLSGQESIAQEFQPFATSTMAGVSGVNYQPASIADTRYKVDILLGGVSLNVGSDFMGLSRDLLFQSSLWNDDNLVDEYINIKHDGKDKNAYVNLGVPLPSFMVSLDDYSAVAFSSGVRSIISVENIGDDLVTLITEDSEYEQLLNRRVSNRNLSIQTHVWTEYGLTYARVIPLPFNKHFVKAGLTLKYLQGNAAAYAYIPELNFMSNGSDSLSIINSDIYYGAAGDFNNIKRFESVSDPGFALSFGFVYEYRPNIENYTYEIDGRKNLVKFDAEKYLVRVGVSILDLGSIRYQKQFGSQDFYANTSDWEIGEIEADNLTEIGEVIADRFNLDPLKKENFNMKLPSVLNVSIDVNLVESLYLNFNPVFKLRTVDKDNPSMAGYRNTYTLAARYDRERFGAALPVTFDESGRVRAGLAFRLGFFWIGSNSLITTFTGPNIYNTDFYAMVKIPIFRKKVKDDDNDGVSNNFDLCPMDRGTWELKGCPDSDNDGITDQNDECPSQAGPEELGGCPDRDNDGIPDNVDDCPSETGIAAFNGCPDTDGDGIQDSNDECPEIAGPANVRGCPDGDNDGIKDSEDDCPDIAGKPEYDGCPFADYDKDGIPNESDNCPSEAGPPEFYGCPDTDGDNVPNNEDLCPEIQGISSLNGCPPLQSDEEEIINNASNSIQFEPKKGILKTESHSALQELASLLIRRKELRILLSGHTENSGKADKDIELSLIRVQAVKDYLIGQGVDEFRIRTEWFGSTKPIANNKTPEGRKKNNRIEIKTDL